MIHYLSHMFNANSMRILQQIQSQIVDLGIMQLSSNWDHIEKRYVSDFHITVMYSNGSFNYVTDEKTQSKIVNPFYSEVFVEELSCFDQGDGFFHIIAKLNAPTQVALHNQLMRNKTATYDYVKYVPHCTLLTLLNLTEEQKIDVIEVIQQWNQIHLEEIQSMKLIIESEMFCLLKEKVKIVTDEQLQSMIEHLTAMTTGSRAEDGLGKFLGDGLPRKDKDGNDYVLRTGLLALALTELQKLRK